MRNPKQISLKVDKICKAIDKRLNGRSHPHENEIIAEECIINDISEKHIRKVRMMNENSKRSRKYREMKA
jgi:hypothetical protein